MKDMIQLLVAKVRLPRRTVAIDEQVLSGSAALGMMMVCHFISEFYFIPYWTGPALLLAKLHSVQSLLANFSFRR